MLATPSAFEGVAAEPTAIVDEPQIEADKGDWEEEENRGRRRELVWLLDLPGQVTPSKWHPQLVPREPDVENEAELWFVQSYGVGLFEVGVRADEVRGSGANWIHRLGHQELGILVSGGCSTQATSGNQRKPGNLDISKRMSDFPETYTAIGCQGAMETQTYES